ncbi:MAG: nicotinate (nicotinamide) nucleotide adenylyltransferase [Balneola sp.]
MRIGLFGGTFDPVHNGHLSIAKSFLKSGKIDQLWVLLTPFPPHKEDENHASYATRLNMLKVAFEEIEHVSILTIENELPKPSYSYNTVRYLIETNDPGYHFYFCIGEDNLAKFHTWKFHEKILDQVRLLVANRPGSDYSQVKNYILEKTTFVNHEPLDISSSEIKDKIHDSEELKKMIPWKVLGIIEQEALYNFKK